MSHTRHVGRRELLIAGAGLGLTPLGCRKGEQRPAQGGSKTNGTTTSELARDVIEDIVPLGAPPWRTFDPFLFCVHHDDAYPRGNAALGPAASLDGRRIGQDFEGKEGWRMYHGDVVPGFPRHPHRGFETVTITRRGFIDHSDSLGATARYGGGDVQWMTAGAGIVHAEMFPLLRREAPNPTELFQIWINLPSKSKFVDPHFSMFWHETIPERTSSDAAGRKTTLRVIAGSVGNDRAPTPPPDSWAANQRAGVAIWTLRLEPGATFSLPPAPKGVGRTLYFFRGSRLLVGTRELQAPLGARLSPTEVATLVNAEQEAEVLLLQGRPIGEPVARRGPFVMNDQQQIQQAFQDYRRTQFGGWPWPRHDPVHAASDGRFAIHANGRRDEPA